jgi:MYXO-CTERM domain-containing protein
MDGCASKSLGPENAFKVLDHAYAEAGESTRAGQRSIDEQTLSEGSLGWFALGALGLLRWRKRRSQAAWTYQSLRPTGSGKEGELPRCATDGDA